MNKKPNVLLIISDQWSTKHVDGYNGLKTPAIKSIADEGISFQQSYSSFPLCCPARASIFTGTMPHTNNIIDNTEIQKHFLGKVPVDHSLATMGMTLKSAGYDTAYFGKEHAGGYGWDGVDNFGSMKYSGGGMIAEGSAYDTIFTKDAIDYLKADHEKPFYMTLSLINPHDICKAFGEKLGGLSITDMMMFAQDDEFPYLRNQERAFLPENFENEANKGMYVHKDQVFKGFNDNEEWTEDRWRKHISVYNLLIEKTDWYIQLVLDTLKTQGLYEDTLVVFTTDHGDMAGSHRLLSKTMLYEEAAKTFMLMRYPNAIKAGQVNHSSLVSTIDLMPTILDFCGIDVPDTVEGKSFKGECMGENSDDFSELYAENPFARMVRYENYKFILSDLYGEKHKILFDLKNDPGETDNCYNKEGYEKISRLLEDKLLKWMEKENLEVRFNFAKIYNKDKWYF